jgi:hypothetical protein
MRTTVIATLLVLLVTPSLGGQVAICSTEKIPVDKRAEPTVSYTVTYLEQDQVRDKCGSAEYLWACSRLKEASGVVPAADEMVLQQVWDIFIDQSLDEANRQCIELHEKAHLAPNLWVHADTYD